MSCNDTTQKQGSDARSGVNSSADTAQRVYVEDLKRGHPYLPQCPTHLRPHPLTLRQANELIARWHRHHQPVHAYRFAIGAKCGDDVVGAVIVARPVARMTNQYHVAEVTRLVNTELAHVSSFLYAAAARAATAMGFCRIQTFILDTEPGISLVAAGWQRDNIVSAGGDWNRPSRGGRRTDQPQQPKQRWSKQLADC